MGTLRMILSIAVLPVLIAVQAVSPKYLAADPSYIMYMPQSAVPGPGPRDQYSDIYPKRAPSLVMDKRKFTSGGWTKRIPEDPDNGVWHTMQKRCHRFSVVRFLFSVIITGLTVSGR